MTTVVFGGAGFVGLNIAEALLSRGEAVTLFDREAPPEAAQCAFRDLPGSLSVVTASVLDADAVAAAMEGAHGAVYGAAVTAGLERDRTAPETTLAVNLDGLMNALRAAHTAGCRAFINLSSAGAFGAAAFRHDVLREDTPTDPVSLYSITKYASERITSRMASVWAMNALSVRLSGVFGRWERKTSVRDTPSPQHQILRAAQVEAPVILPRPEARDWIYATDVASAVIALRDADRLPHDLYHVSTGTRWSVADWTAELATHMPSLRWRMAEPGEAATIDYHAAQDRGMLSIDRLLADADYRPAFTLSASAADYAAWAQRSG
ncbi:MAG: NAD(P)-dependent oxidoreductase [Pseudomonadota bacterium]